MWIDENGVAHTVAVPPEVILGDEAVVALGSVPRDLADAALAELNVVAESVHDEAAAQAPSGPTDLPDDIDDLAYPPVFPGLTPQAGEALSATVLRFLSEVPAEWRVEAMEAVYDVLEPPWSDDEDMRAVVFTEPGPSTVLTLVDRDLPEPGPGEVRVRLVRAGVNPTDWKRRHAPLGFDEVTPGQDGAGVVDAVGTGVDDLAVGDRVWLVLAQNDRAYGTAAEHTVQAAAQVVPLPDDASFDLGASLGVPAVTAHRALTSSEPGPSRLGPGAMAGMTVLVAGGAGAVGNAAIQLARWSGATVVTTVSSPEKEALATAAGAHHVVNYRAVDPESAIRAVAPDGVDLVVEVAPAQNIELDVAVTKVHGTVAIYANNGGDEMTVQLRSVFSKNLRFQFLILYTLDEALLRAATEDVSAAVAAGALRVGEDVGVPLHFFPLEQTAAAHDAVEAGAIGKVLIRVSEE